MDISDFLESGHFRHQFADTLEEMLVSAEVGAFILVLANSMQESSLREKLAPSLQRIFSHFSRDGFETANQDDRVVLDSLIESGIDGLSCWESRHEGAYEIVLNPLRSLRPARLAKQPAMALCEPFNPDSFNFNRPFLRPEILSEGSYREHDFRVLYNKFPFAPFHLLIAPDPQRCLPQCLGTEHHMMMWELVEECASVLPGLAVAYNSLGAGASVNHLHFQGAVRSEAFPVESLAWRHNGGDIAYPANCLVADTAVASLEMITDFHCRERPYNLLYRPGRLYLFPRSPAPSGALPSWCEGVAWHEMSGVMTVAERRYFEEIREGGIRQLLACS